jgi:hypothetical protein
MRPIQVTYDGDQHCKALPERNHEALHKHAGGALTLDDVTLIVMEVRG